MTITIQLWMLIPGLCILGAIIFLVLGARETGMFGGCFHGALALCLLVAAVAFLLGRWML